MANPNLNTALKWAIENTTGTENAGGQRTQINQEALAALFLGADVKSDIDSMKDSMAVIGDKEATRKNRLQAFENFQQLVENLDNANTMASSGLWTPLVAQLENEDAEFRIWAAWCCTTAVQNNIKTQERVSDYRFHMRLRAITNSSQLLIVGAIPTLVRMATGDADKQVRKKAISTLSSTVRNFQPGLDEALAHMPTEYKPEEKLDANDMESVDLLINRLRASV